MHKQKLVVSFSGGRTSAYMGKYLLDNFSNKYDFLFLFANTGQEHEKTLEFIKNCDDNFGFNTVWLESVVYHNERKSNGYKVVNFETACRDKTLFEEMIKKHGIPNMAFPHCTRELKLAPINNYIKDCGWSDALIALGIRADETRRVSDDAVKRKIIYPLIDLEIDKQDVLDWWKKQSFDLDIYEHEGNCTWCWKKTTSKHYLNLSKNADWYDVPEYLEEKYGFVGHEYREDNLDKPLTPRVFFRGGMSTKALKKSLYESLGTLFPIDDYLEKALKESELSNTCSESCELYSMEFKND